jgi:hypothetical protein
MIMKHDNYVQQHIQRIVLTGLALLLPPTVLSAVITGHVKHINSAFPERTELQFVSQTGGTTYRTYTDNQDNYVIALPNDIYTRIDRAVANFQHTSTVTVNGNAVMNIELVHDPGKSSPVYSTHMEEVRMMLYWQDTIKSVWEEQDRPIRISNDTTITLLLRPYFDSAFASMNEWIPLREAWGDSTVNTRFKYLGNAEMGTVIADTRRDSMGPAPSYAPKHITVRINRDRVNSAFANFVFRRELERVAGFYTNSQDGNMICRDEGVAGATPSAFHPDEERVFKTAYDVKRYRPLVEDSDTAVTVISSVRIEPPTINIMYRLEQNYPNPFNPSTTISFSLPRTEVVSLKVYDLLGREIATLVEGREEAGEHSATWNAKSLASGVYFYQLKAGGFVETKKLLLLR